MAIPRATWVVVMIVGLGVAAPASAWANPIASENRAAGTTAWQAPIETSGIAGYPTSPSVSPGASLNLHVSVSGDARYRVEVYRLGWYQGLGGRLVTCLPSCSGSLPGVSQPPSSIDPYTGEATAGWPVTNSIVVESTWTSGYYVAKLVRLALDGSSTSVDVPFVVLGQAQSPSSVLVVVPVDTWQAYNPWGGKSLYAINSSSGVPAEKVSFERPLAVDRPDYAAGQNNFLNWELPLVHFLESRDLDVSYETDVDVNNHPSSLLDHRLVIVAGHSEYWTTTIRTAYDVALKAGTNLVFAGANDGYWRVRYEDGGSTMVGYKEQAAQDPDQSEPTTQFRQLSPPDPECALLGVEHQGGRPSTAVPNPTIIPNAAALGDPWFSGTGLDSTTVLRGYLGYEWDSPVAGCVPSSELTVLLTAGPDAPAPYAAVRLTPAVGGVVFSAGSLQFSWALDDSRTSANPGIQALFTNVLDDLVKLRPPTKVIARSHGSDVDLSAVGRTTDPRILKVTFYRTRAAVTASSRIAWVTATTCNYASTKDCVDRPKPGRYRYAARFTDQWGSSVVVAGTHWIQIVTKG